MTRAHRLHVMLALVVGGACGAQATPQADSASAMRSDRDSAAAAQDADAPVMPRPDAHDTARVVRSGPVAPPVTILDAAGATDDSVWFTFRDGRLPGIEVRYTHDPVTECGSGDPVTTAGTALMLVRLSPTDAHEFDGERAFATVTDRRRSLNGSRVLRLDMICDFEAQVEWVVSLTQPVGFRLRTPDNSGRFVIELAPK